MKREDILQALLQNMEAIGKGMLSRKTERSATTLPTHAQIGILLVLQHEGPQSIKDLAAKFRMTSSAATQLVTGLVNDKLLTRIEDKTDRRKMHVEMTAKGKRILALARKEREKTMIQLFAPLTDSELLQLEKFQRKITERLQLLWTQSKNK